MKHDTDQNGATAAGHKLGGSVTDTKRREAIRLMMGTGVGLAWSVAAMSTMRSAAAAHHESAMPKVDEANDATAKALGYKHDASTVDPARRADASMVCSSCQLFAAGENGWGNCTLFPGKLVNANGWCSGWVKKVG